MDDIMTDMGGHVTKPHSQEDHRESFSQLGSSIWVVSGPTGDPKMVVGQEMWKGEMVVSQSMAVHHITTKLKTKNDEYILHLSVLRFAGSQRMHL